jgi:hypothetical protein
VPVGALPVTVAVKVTLCPVRLGLALEPRLVLVLVGGTTIWLTVGERLPVLRLSPE